VNVDEFGKCHDNGTGATYDTLRRMAWTIVASGGHFHIDPLHVAERVRNDALGEAHVELFAVLVHFEAILAGFLAFD
jgi:hypothetical protein